MPLCGILNLLGFRNLCEVILRWRLCVSQIRQEHALMLFQADFLLLLSLLCWDEVFWCDWYFNSWLEQGGVKSTQIQKQGVGRGGTRLAGGLFMERSCPWIVEVRMKKRQHYREGRVPSLLQQTHSNCTQSWRWTFSWVADSVLTHSTVPKPR